MKKLILLAVLLGIIQIMPAQKLITKNGHIQFLSHTPVEDIEAHNHQVVSILDTELGEIQFNLLIKSFEFDKKLMRKHFNENYMESDEFPKASFKGNITNIDAIDFSKDGNYEVSVRGDLSMHGITREVISKGTITINNKEVNAKAKFLVATEDYNIEIPSMVKKKIAEEIEVSVDVNYIAN